MNKMTKVAAFVGLAMVSAGASATDWNVTQTADIEVAAPSITQGAAAQVSSSNQAINGIVLDIANDDLATGSQTANIASSTGVSLTQGSNVDNSTQSVNLIVAENIGSTSTITQTVNQTEVSLTNLVQTDAGSAGSNTQGANVANAAADVDRLSQVYTEAGALTVSQAAVTTSANTQGVNIVRGENIGTIGVTQSVTVDGVALMEQTAANTGGSNTQVGNGAISTSGDDIDNTTQSFTATTSNLSLVQSAAGTNNIQAGNMMSTANNGDIGVTAGTTTQTLTVSAGDANFNQNVSASGNVQAGNLAISGGSIVDLTQTVTASGASEVDFDQTPTAASNVQAGNMAQLTAGGTGDVIDEISQVFTSSTTLTDFDQVSGSGNLIQAGNLIDITTGDISDSGTTQQFDVTAGSLTMDQEGAGTATGNLQALNAIVDDAGNGSGGTVSQVLNITATTFSMNQNNIAGSGQYGNFVGVKL